MQMQEHEARFEAFLAKKGLKFTQGRRLILEMVFNLHEHFDVEQMYDRIRKLSRDVSRATVYRTIPLLVEAGLIQRSVRGETRDTYEHIFGHPKHAHWVCTKCGILVETNMRELTRILQNSAKTQNFSISDISLEIKGHCWKCKIKENESQ